MIHSMISALPRIPPHELTMSTTNLGNGFAGNVTKGKWKAKDVAIKILHPNIQEGRHSYSDSLKKLFDREAKIMATVNHPSIVSLLGVCIEKSGKKLVMELMEGGSLRGFLFKTKKPVPVLRWAHEIALGLAYMHAKNIIHRDLKPANILLTKDNHAKIADFGFARNIDYNLQHSMVVGSPIYMAPELHAPGTTIDKASDIYAYAMVVWNMVSRKEINLGRDRPTLIRNIQAGSRPLFPPNGPRAFEQLLLFCWPTNPEKRWTADQVVLYLEDLKVGELWTETRDLPLALYARFIQNMSLKKPALEFLKQAAAKGCAEAQRDLGKHHLYSKRPQQALAYFELAAVQDDAEALFSAAKILESSEPKKALRYYQRSAALGYYQAVGRLGHIYLVGRPKMGIIPAPTMAIPFLEKAATYWIPEAQYELGHCLLYGYGKKQKPDEALTHLLRAYRQGIVQAAIYIEAYYKKMQNPKEAAKWAARKPKQLNNSEERTSSSPPSPQTKGGFFARFFG